MTMIAFKKQLIKIALVACFAIFTLISNAQVRLPQLVSNDMVLQRDVKLKIWGWASPGEKVTLAFINKSYHTVADKSGNWSVELKPMKAGGPYSMDITGSNHIELNNILIGDVYFFSGQSNMTVMMERVKERYPEEIETANYPQIKYFFVPTASDAFKEHEDLPKGNWVTIDHQHILNIGAVPNFFAKQLYAKYKIPLGLINSSVGGTLIQAWVSDKGLKNLEPYASRLSQIRDTAFVNQANRQNRSFTPRLQRGQTTEVDKGMTEAVKWYDPKYEVQGWHKFWLPGYWEDQGVKGLHGIVWFRKEVDVPSSMAGKPAKLFVGRIVDADETYVNGVKVGNITYQYPPRRYNIPEGVLKAGKNIIIVRVTNTADKGGFVPDKRYELTDGNTSIDIRGDWLYKVGEVYPPRTGGFDANGGGAGTIAVRVNPQNEPAGLYNAMIAPALNYAVKGFLWYQGEANADSPKDYNALMAALINDWRNKWNEPDAPFFFVQLPNYMEVKYSPSESNWAELREAQRLTLSLPNTAMAVAIDLGEWNDIHPLNKKDVGERLALAAERIVYGDANVVYSGPTVQSSAKEGKQITLTFTNVGSGLMAKGGGELQQFAIAGADKHFVWAKAKIAGNNVIVNSDEVADPQYVRYAWADNPEGANLYNNEGLPASPFMINTKQ